MDEFGQKAKQHLKMGFNFLHKKAQQTVDLAKLQSQLRQEQETKEQALIALAERVCVMFDMDTFQPEELKDSVTAIRETQARIQQLEHQIQEVRHTDESPSSPGSPESHPESPEA